MKKISLIFVAVMIAALAGCAGDSTTEPGTLANVASLELDNSSTGRTINLVWSEVTDVDGYKIYFKADGTGDWSEIGTSTTTAYTDADAMNAGTYSVRAYKGDDLSADYATAVSTMPNIISTTFTIYDNYSAADTYSGFIFGATDGTAGSAASTGFAQDIYAFDRSKGDADVWLYSGNFGDFGNGNQAYFQVPAETGYGFCEPSGTWFNESYILYTSDSVVFVRLPFSGNTNAYVKMYNLSVTPDPNTDNGTIVSFSYEYQPDDRGLTVFSSRAN